MRLIWENWRYAKHKKSRIYSRSKIRNYASYEYFRSLEFLLLHYILKITRAQFVTRAVFWTYIYIYFCMGCFMPNCVASYECVSFCMSLCRILLYVAYIIACTVTLLRWEMHTFMNALWLTEISLTRWSRVTHICVSKITIIGSDIGWSPSRRHRIIWTNAKILLI